MGRYYLFGKPAAVSWKRHYRAKKIQFDFGELFPEAHVPPALEGHPLSVAMMQDYPVVESDGYLFFTEEAFRIIDPHVDMRFFVKGELTLPGRNSG